MSRKQHGYRRPGKRAHRQQDQPASTAGNRGGVQQTACPEGLSPFPRSGVRHRYLVPAVCGLLLLAVGLVFGQTVRHPFANYDDGEFVYENPHVAPGLTGKGIFWAFSHFEGHYWIPLCRLSSMLDCQLYGLNAGGHHLTNVLLHATTAVLLFLVLGRLTGGFWPSALVAALFAVHPLHVESVAWVTERKDMLSGLFFVLTLGAYGWYARRPFSLSRYLLLVTVFVMGLMAKPMLVTLPLVLLLLDYWPLRRMASAADISPAGGERRGRFSLPMRCVLDKIPLLLLVALFCGVTYWTMSNVVASEEQLPFSWRIANALVSYVAYLSQFICPLGLAPFYPHPGTDLPLWKVIGAGVVLASISAGVLACRRRYPYLLVGWLWYAGMLVPVIGLVQVGAAAMADRFTYLPQIGLDVALAWGAADLCRSWPSRRWVCGIASASVFAALMGCAWRQTSFWRDSETLWTHALACTSRNNVAHNNLGLALAGRDRLDEAMAHYREALEIKPSHVEALTNLGVAFARLGRFGEAMAQYRQALEIKPDAAETHYDLGVALARLGRFDEAMAHYRKALEIKPDHFEALNNLGVALARLGRLGEAIAQYRQALEIKPGYLEAHNNLGNALADGGQFDEAMAQYRQALEIKPDSVEAHNNLGRLLARLGRFGEATAQYRQAVEIKPDSAEAYNNLGRLFTRLNRFGEATAQYQKALEIEPGSAEARCNLGIAFARLGRIDEAMAQFREALKIKPELAEAHHNLGIAAARLGRFDEAVAHYRKALELATQQNNQALADALRAAIASCEAGRPHHQTPPPSAPRPKP